MLADTDTATAIGRSTIAVHERAPRYLADHFILASDAAPRHLHLYDPLT